MPSKRTGYAPWSLTREAGVQSATVNGTIDIPQNIQPVLDTGFVDEQGNWKGVKSSDEEFFAFTKHIAVDNGGETLSPATDTVDHIDMTGFSKIYLAIKPTRGGNVAIKAVMGPDTNRFANLSPVNPGENLRGSNPSSTGNAIDDLFSNAAESLTADVWNIYIIGATNNELIDQKLLQFKITNNAGGASDLEVAFMRIV